MRIPKAMWGLVRETARHLLRRPVVGFVVWATVPDGRVALIRRGDTGGWALPGGTLEWGETLRSGLGRELLEETGAQLLSAGELLGVYSDPNRDPRFHAVTIIVSAKIAEPSVPVMNSLEILEVKLMAPSEIPTGLSHGLDDVVDRIRRGVIHWE